MDNHWLEMVKRKYTACATKNRSFLLNKKGFSLVELMVTLLLIGIVSVAVGALFMNVQKFYKHTSARISAREEASQILRTMEAELRQISQSSDDLEAMKLADKNQLTFFADVDNDSAAEKINYALNGQSIIKTITKASDDVASTLTTQSVNSADVPIFKYYQAIDEELTQLPLSEVNRSRVKIIKISISIKSADSTKEDKLETEIYLRNKNEPL